MCPPWRPPCQSDGGHKRARPTRPTDCHLQKLAERQASRSSRHVWSFDAAALHCVNLAVQLARIAGVHICATRNPAGDGCAFACEARASVANVASTAKYFMCRSFRSLLHAKRVSKREVRCSQAMRGRQPIAPPRGAMISPLVPATRLRTRLRRVRSQSAEASAKAESGDPVLWQRTGCPLSRA